MLKEKNKVLHSPMMEPKCGFVRALYPVGAGPQCVCGHGWPQLFHVVDADHRVPNAGIAQSPFCVRHCFFVCFFLFCFVFFFLVF